MLPCLGSRDAMCANLRQISAQHATARMVAVGASTKLCALLLLTCVVLGLAAAVAGPSPQAQQFDALANVEPRQSTTVFQEWQGTTDETLLVLKMDPVVRLSGERFVPFTVADQRVVVQALRDVYLARIGPVELTSYKESYPDPAAPSGMSGSTPAVEFSFTAYWVLSKATMDQLAANASYAISPSEAFAAFFAWSSAAVGLGNWNGVGSPQILTTNFNAAYLQRGFTLHPIIILQASLSLPLTDTPGGLGAADYASVVAQAVEAAILGGIGTLVEVVNSTLSEDAGDHTLGGVGALGGTALVELEVTMFMCRDNATVASPECEEQVLAAVLLQLKQSAEVLQLWQSNGIQSVEVTGIRQRQPPPPPSNATVPVRPWVPWHLDRIDQRSLPLDGKFTATASGTGVNVYIVSSGVYSAHEQFGYTNGVEGSRVEPAWGYQGLNPSEDCPDGRQFSYGFGTYVASLCCGLQLGAARNATIHSVRIREMCMELYSPEALISAMDFIISNHTMPAVVLIDTWWYPGRLTSGSADVVRQALTDRLTALAQQNITIVAAAGPGLNLTRATPCENIIASHPDVISVAPTDTYDQATAFGPRNSSCIDIWAPAGGLGTSLIGAQSSNPSAYVANMPRAFGSAAVVAGVVAQFLQLHPDATPSQVRQAFLGNATQHKVTGAGTASPSALLYTDFQQADPGREPPAVVSSGGGLGTAGTAAIAVVASLAVVAAAVAGFAYRARRHRRLVRAKPLDSSSAWEIDLDTVEICRRPDGSLWLLGEGQYGKVYKALKRGVQVVAVKQLSRIDERVKQMFIQEIETMKYVSRDANICQFYGASIKGDNVVMVIEYMEGGDVRQALSSDKAEELQWYKSGKDVMCDIVRGVDFLHSSQVVHRDIKSKNILLGRDGRAKLADVGLAQLFDAQQPGKAEFVGTLAWAAPEILRGEPCTDKADMYSLGVVLWELVTQEVPQRGCLRDPRVPEECPQGVVDAIQACMQVDAASRPDARELYAFLQACPPFHHANETASAASSIKDKEHPWSRLGTPAGAGSADEGLSSTKGKATTSASLTPTSSSDPETRSASYQHLASELSMVARIDMDKVEFCRNPDGSRQMLGSGSFGKVFKVLLEGVQPLAAKEIGLMDDPAVHVTFLQEAAILWRLRHPNLVGLTGVAISGDMGYLFMELMEAGSLYAKLGVLSCGQRVFGWYNRGRYVALEVAKGLHYLHSMRTTHFDVKAANVLLTRQFHAKLSDCGLAKLMPLTHHSLSSDDDSATLLGTLAYMAPELLAGSKCTESVDIYSFGVLLLELCTGTHPQRSRKLELEVPQDCPQAVADLYMQCTAFDPAARPTARELVQRLSLLVRAKEALPATEPPQPAVMNRQCSAAGDYMPQASPFLPAAYQQ